MAPSFVLKWIHFPLCKYRPYLSGSSLFLTLQGRTRLSERRRRRPLRHGSLARASLYYMCLSFREKEKNLLAKRERGKPGQKFTQRPLSNKHFTDFEGKNPPHKLIFQLWYFIYIFSSLNFLSVASSFFSVLRLSWDCAENGKKYFLPSVEETFCFFSCLTDVERVMHT